MQTLITYGSQYGSAERYARKFAERTGFPIVSFCEAKNTGRFDRVIHFGALYAGGVLGLRKIVSLLPAEARLCIVTVGLADVEDAENIRNIQKSIASQVSEEVLRRTEIFHLRGAIDYSMLNLRHRAMMALLYAKAKGLPEEEKNAETRAMIETYGKRVSFFSEDALCRLIDAIKP